MSILQELEQEIANIASTVEKTNVGIIREVGDGVAKVEGLSDVQLNEMIEFPGGVTGLAMNETRSKREILALEANRDSLGSVDSLNASDSLSDSSSLLAKAQPKRNCWTTYLSNNPAMQQWADANPGPAGQNRRRFDDC